MTVQQGTKLLAMSMQLQVWLPCAGDPPTLLHKHATCHTEQPSPCHTAWVVHFLNPVKLQHGTSTHPLCLPLQSLLRQGREATETILQLPITPPTTAGSTASSATPAHLIIRLINIGQAPAGPGAAVGTFDDGPSFRPSSPSKAKVRVRAAPFQPGSPVAADLGGRDTLELRARAHTDEGHGGSPVSSPAARKQAFGLQPGATAAAWRTMSGPGTAPSGPSPPAGAGHSPRASPQAGAADLASEILSFEMRKAERSRELQQLLQPDSPSKSPGKTPVRIQCSDCCTAL